MVAVWGESTCLLVRACAHARVSACGAMCVGARYTYILIAYLSLPYILWPIRAFQIFCLSLSGEHFAPDFFISFIMFQGLIDGRLERVLRPYKEQSLTEIRLRVGRALTVYEGVKKHYVTTDSGVYVVTKDDVDRVLSLATDFSLYVSNDRLTKGYLVKDGIRVGVVGRGVMDGDTLTTITDVNALVIRIPHQVFGCGDKVISQVMKGDSVLSTLVISPPGAGKTTLLRDMARQVSTVVNTLVIDERFELGGIDNSLDLGECEVMSGVPKTMAYEFGVRASSPSLVVTDEIFHKTEVDSVKDIVRCGVKVFASVHGSLPALKNNEIFRPLLGCFQCFVTLAPIGEVVSVEYE